MSLFSKSALDVNGMMKIQAENSSVKFEISGDTSTENFENLVGLFRGARVGARGGGGY